MSVAEGLEEFRPGNLEAKFVAPPFSVLDTRQGYWQERRRRWLALGIRSELGRGEEHGVLSQATERREERVVAGAGMLYAEEVHGLVGRMGADYDTAAGENAWGGSGTSIFDPVLCELAYRWWAPAGGSVIDPFAGGSVRGIVAARLGHPYTGIDLSGAQLAANRAQAAAMLEGPEQPVPTWLQGDTLEVLPTLPAASFDMLLTCPPYFDLEVYSQEPEDLSNMPWGQFVEAYAEAMARSAHLLRSERFAVWVVSEVRDREGYCRGLVPLTVQVAEAAGLRLYNEAVLVNAVGSLPLRVGKYMEASRKLGRAHQNVLCFIKGRPPRGWSWDRPAPPDPQLGLGLMPEPEPSQPALAPAAAAEPEPVREGGEQPDAAPGPFTASEPLEVLEEGTLEWVADVEGLPQAGLEELAEELGEPATPEAAGLRPLADGRWADPSTGEILEALPRTPAERRPLRIISTTEPPMPQEEWELRRGKLWNPGDKNRPCWTCGRPPAGAYHDGSPSYDHTHNEEALTLFGGGA